MRYFLGVLALATLGSAQLPNQRCGVNYSDANSRCGTPCPRGTDGECPGSERCYAQLSTAPCEGQGPSPTPGPAPGDFPLSDGAVGLIKIFEGWRNDFYLDAVGIATIGYGHACHVNDCTRLVAQRADGSTYTITATRIGSAPGYRLDNGPLTEQQGSDILRRDLETNYAACMRTALRNRGLTGMPAEPFGALVSLAFNIGCGGARDSTALTRVVNRESTARIREGFVMWRNAGGQCLNGLVRRRNAEVDFLSGGCGGTNCNGCGDCSNLYCSLLDDEFAVLPAQDVMGDQGLPEVWTK